MWRMTLPNAGAPHMGAHHASHTHSRLEGLKHALSQAVKPQVARCSVCHVDLLPGDVAQGYCSDTDGCSCRAFSARCW